MFRLLWQIKYLLNVTDQKRSLNIFVVPYLYTIYNTRHWLCLKRMIHYCKSLLWYMEILSRTEIRHEILNVIKIMYLIMDKESFQSPLFTKKSKTWNLNFHLQCSQTLFRNAIQQTEFEEIFLLKQNLPFQLFSSGLNIKHLTYVYIIRDTSNWHKIYLKLYICFRIDQSYRMDMYMKT